MQSRVGRAGEFGPERGTNSGQAGIFLLGSLRSRVRPHAAVSVRVGIVSVAAMALVQIGTIGVADASDGTPPVVTVPADMTAEATRVMVRW